MAKKKVEALTIEEKLQTALIPVDKQPYKIPQNWCWVNQGSICNLVNGEKINNAEYPYLDVKYLRGLKDKKIINNGNFVPSGTKLILVDGENSGEVFTAIEDGYMGSTFKVLKPLKNVNANYLDYFVLTKKEFYKYFKRGTAIPHLDKALFNPMPFPLPPLAEQERIVNKLDNYISKLDEAKEKLEKVVDTYNYRKNLILHRAFTGQLTKNWRKENNISFDNWKEFLLKDVLLPMTSKKPIGEYFKYIDIDSIDNEFQEVKEPKYIQTEKASSRANRELKTGDVIFSLVRPYLRNIAFIDETLSDCIASTGFYVCRANKEIIPEYLYKFLCFDKTIGYLNKFMRGFNSPSIRNNDLLNMPINLPPLEEQKEIVKILDSILSKEKQVKEIAEKEIEKIEDLKKNLLTRAFGGLLGTNDPNEENSIELLKSVL
ncbi:restriction endonuclease subunit S [bacterium]|nr:restriction endonuclease subunit S [bacterium]